jgi:hypothetical protein
MTFRQHIPGFCSGLEPTTFEFKNTEELLSSDFFIKQKNSRKDFSHFALSDNRIMLIAEEGRWWWVVGYVDEPSKVEFVKWDGGKTKKQ